MKLKLVKILEWIDVYIFNHCFHRFGFCTFVMNLLERYDTEIKEEDRDDA